MKHLKSFHFLIPLLRVCGLSSGTLCVRLLLKKGIFESIEQTAFVLVGPLKHSRDSLSDLCRVCVGVISMLHYVALITDNIRFSVAVS